MHRRTITDSRMQARSIIEAFDPVDDIQPGVGAGSVASLINPFHFQGFKKLSIAALSQALARRPKEAIMP